MTTDMTDRPDTALATVADDGMAGEFDETDISIPSVTLVQPMTPDKGGAEDGDWLFSDGRSFPTIDVVVLHIAATRDLWGTRESDEGLICKSQDRRMGFTEVPLRVFGPEANVSEPMNIVCQECPHFDDDQFAKSTEGNLLCKKGYTLLLYEVEHKFPFIYYVQGAAMKPIKARVVGPARLHWEQTGASEPWRFIYHVEGKKNTTKFTFWTPDFFIPKDGLLEEDERDRYASLSRSYRGSTTEAMEGDDEDTQAQSETVRDGGEPEPRFTG